MLIGILARIFGSGAMECVRVIAATRVLSLSEESALKLEFICDLHRSTRRDRSL